MSAIALQKALEKVLCQPQQDNPTPDSEQQKDDAPAVKETFREVKANVCRPHDTDVWLSVSIIEVLYASFALQDPDGAPQKARHVATTADHIKQASSLPNAHQNRRGTRADLAIANQCLAEQHAAGLQGAQVQQQGRKRRTCMQAADAAAAGAQTQSTKRFAAVKDDDASAAAAAAPKAAAGKKQLAAVTGGMSKAAEGAAASSKRARAAGTAAADPSSAHKRMESTVYPNIKSRGDGKFQVFLCSQGLKYLHGKPCLLQVSTCVDSSRAVFQQDHLYQQQHVATGCSTHVLVQAKLTMPPAAVALHIRSTCIGTAHAGWLACARTHAAMPTLSAPHTCCALVLQWASITTWTRQNGCGTWQCWQCMVHSACLQSTQQRHTGKQRSIHHLSGPAATANFAGALRNAAAAVSELLDLCAAQSGHQHSHAG
jgi:hypothetical protein